MVHTARFYIELLEEELKEFQNIYGGEYKKICKSFSNFYEGFTVWIKDEYGIKLYFDIDFIKLLKTEKIVEDDYFKIEESIKKFLNDMFEDTNIFSRVVMIRLDYRKDIVVPEENRKLFLYLYKKASEKIGFQKKYDQYDTTIYFNSKSIQATCYDKEADVKAKNRKLELYEKDVLRFEVRLQNSHLKYGKYKKDIAKSLREYFKQDLYEQYMEKYLGKILYKGDYYKINRVKTILSKSNLKDKEQKELIEFLIDVSKYGIEYTKNKNSKYKIQKYIQQLEILQINPILIPKNRKDFPSFMKNPLLI